MSEAALVTHKNIAPSPDASWQRNVECSIGPHLQQEVGRERRGGNSRRQVIQFGPSKEQATSGAAVLVIRSQTKGKERR